jgi:hypothetical protein
VPADAPAFAAASVVPGRLWQAFEALAGGLWPLQTTLVSTQIAGWELNSSQRVVEDLLGLTPQLASVYVPRGRSAEAAVATLPMADPQGMLAFFRWAIEAVAPLVPGLHGEVQGGPEAPTFVVHGLLPALGLRARELYVAPAAGLWRLSADRAALLQAIAAAQAAQGDQMAPHADTGTAAQPAVAFGTVQHLWLQGQLRRWGRTHAPALLGGKALVLPPGASAGWLEADAAGLQGTVRSSLRAAPVAK